LPCARFKATVLGDPEIVLPAVTAVAPKPAKLRTALIRVLFLRR
jgi:hypothetical protein